MGFVTGAYLRFALSDYRCFVSVAENDYFKIVYTLKHEGWDELELANGSDLLNMPGTVHLTAFDDPLKDSKRIGALHYIGAYAGSDDGVIKPSPDHFSIECLVPREFLDRIFESEKAQLGPTSLEVSVSDGIKYGWAPDGSVKIWESENDWVPIEQISMTFQRLSLKDSGDEVDETHDPDELEVPSNQIELATIAMTKKVEQSLTWIVGLLALIVAILVFR